MKRLLISLSALLVGIAGWWLGSPDHVAVAPQVARTASSAPPPASTITDPATVFQKAFWKRPTPEDQILHAERREWKDDSGISKWQWFISVKPSPLLVAHLITDNAFGLSGSHGVWREPTTEPPRWFPKEAGAGAQVFTGSSGTFTLVWDKERNLLHATDSGSGFRPGAPEPAQPVASAPSTPAGRLPSTPPPKP